MRQYKAGPSKVRGGSLRGDSLTDERLKQDFVKEILVRPVSSSATSVKTASFLIEPRGWKCTLFWHKLGEICCQLVPSGNRNSIYFIGSFFLQPLISSSYVLVTQCPSKRLTDYKLVKEINNQHGFQLFWVAYCRFLAIRLLHCACLHCVTAPSYYLEPCRQSRQSTKLFL
jgi:hypothetical protein